MAGYELATAYVNLVASSDSISSAIAKGMSAGQRVAASEGQKAGQTFGKAFASQKPIDLDAAAKKAAAQVEVAAGRVEKARGLEEAAARKVAIEEAKLNELRGNSNAKTSQILSAEDRLARAKDQSALASEKVKAATEHQAAAVEKADKANEELAQSQRKAGAEADQTGQKFGGLKDRIKAAFSGNFKDAFAKVPKAADDAGNKVERSFEGVGKRSGKSFGAGFKRMLGPIMAAISAGAVIKVGFEGAKALQSSTKTLTGLYNSAKDATDMMGMLKEVAKDSPLELTGYSKAAETLAYAGVKGRKAADVLKNVGKAIVTAGGDTTKLDQAMGGLLKGVNNGGIAMMDSLGQISESGVPILSGLADKFGTTTDQIKKMASKSQISVEDVLDVMQNGTGGTFQQMIDASDTASSSVENQWKIAKDKLSVTLGEAFQPLLDILGPKIGPAADIAAAALKGIGAAAKVIVENMGPLMWVVAAVTTLWIAHSIAAWASVAGVTTLAGAFKVLFASISAGIKSIPVIGWIIAGIMLLIGVLTWFFTKTEVGRKLWDKIWGGIKAAAAAVFEWFVAYVVPVWNTVMAALGAAAVWLWNSVLKPTFAALGAFFGWVWNTLIKPAFDGMVWLWQGVIAPAAIWLWMSVLQPVFSAIGAFFSWWWNNVTKPIFMGLVWLWQNVLSPVISWLWNGVILPIFSLIGAFFKLWWTGVKAIFNALVAIWKNVVAPIISWLWNGVILPIFSLIGAFFKLWWTGVKAIFNALVTFYKTVLGPIFQWLWNNIIKPIFSWIKAYIQAWWNGVKIIFNAVKNFLKDVLGPAFRWLYDHVVKPVFQGMKNTISSIWNGGIKPVFQTLGNFIKDKVAPAFRTGVEAIKKAWKGIENAAKAPVRFVVNTVINRGIVDQFNKIAGFFHTKKMTPLGLPKGFDRGGWTGPGARLTPAGVVHADEFVVQKKSRRKIERENPGFLDYVNRTGEIPMFGSFAKGGMVWNNLWAIVKKQFPGVQLHSAYRPGAITSSGNRSYHSMGKAIDISPRMDIFNWLHDHFGQSAELIFSPAGGRQIKDGHHHMYTGAVRRMHFNHIHWANRTAFSGDTAGATGAGGGGLDIGQFLNPFEGFKKKIEAGMSKWGPYGDMMKAGAKRLIEMPIKFVKDKWDSVAGAVSAAAEKAGDFVAKGSAKAQVRSRALGYGWAGGAQWKALDWLIEHESGWNPNAANPTSSARGLFQKMTSIHGPVEKTPFGQAGWGLKYIKDRFGSPTAAKAFWQKHHWYDRGGLVTPKIPLFDQGGLLKRGIQVIQHKSNKPDRVLTASQWDAVYAAAKAESSQANGNTYHFTTPVIERNEVSDYMASLKFEMMHLAKSDAFSGVNG